MRPPPFSAGDWVPVSNQAKVVGIVRTKLKLNVCLFFSGLTVFNKVLSACVGEEACNPSLAQYTVEVLRVLFNLTCNTRTEDTQELVQISGTLNTVFNQTFQDEVSKNLVVSNAINLLTNFDGSKELTAGLIAGNDLKNIQTILSFLMTKLEQLAGTNHLSLKVRNSIHKTTKYIFISNQTNILRINRYIIATTICDRATTDNYNFFITSNMSRLPNAPWKFQMSI